MERREVEQKSDREVEVGVLIGKKQVPLSPLPPDTHAREDGRPLAAYTNTHAHTPTHHKGTKHRQSANTQSPVNRQNIHKHSHAHTHNGNFIQHLLGVNETVCCQTTYTHTRLQVSDRRHLHTDSSDRLPSSCHGNEYH